MGKLYGFTVWISFQFFKPFLLLLCIKSQRNLELMINQGHANDFYVLINLIPFFFFSFLSRTNKCETMAFLLIRLTGLIYFWDKFASLSLVKNRKEHRAVDHWTMGEFSQRWGWGWEWSRAGLHSRQTDRRTGRYTDRQGIIWLGTGSQ